MKLWQRAVVALIVCGLWVYFAVGMAAPVWPIAQEAFGVVRGFIYFVVFHIVVLAMVLRFGWRVVAVGLAAASAAFAEVLRRSR